MSRILSERDEIRQWATARAGNPMLLDTPQDRVLLQISFGQHALNAEGNEGPDHSLTGGWQLTGWDEWFEEFEKNNMAIKVNDDQPGMLDNDFAFVQRDGEGETTDAARKPAAITVQSPNDEDRAAPDAV